MPGLRDFLHATAEFDRRSGFLLEHGREFDLTGAVVDPGGKPKECYHNCLIASMRFDDLTYCEGFATVHDFPVHHAWLVDADGRLHDPTWTTVGDVYFGVAFAARFVAAEAVRREMAGILDHRFPHYDGPLPDGVVRDMVTDIDRAGRTISTRPIYSHRR